MKMLVSNYLRDSETGITVVGGSDSFPIDRMTNNTLKEITTVTGNVDIDLQEAKEVTYFAIKTDSFAGTLSAGDTVDRDDFELPVLSLSVGEEIKIFKLSSAQTYRYWRFTPVNGYTSDPYIDWATNVSPGDSVVGMFPEIMQYDDSFPTFYNFMNAYWMSPNSTYGYGEVSSGLGTDWSDDEDIEDVGPFLSMPSFADATLGLVNIPDQLVQLRLDSVPSGTLVNLPIYYSRDAYLYARENFPADSRFYFDLKGSVYALSIEAESPTLSIDDLVVNYQGLTGPKGSATPDLTTEDVPTTTSINYIFLGKSLDLPNIQGDQVPTKQRNDLLGISASGVLDSTMGIRWKELTLEYPVPTYAQFSELDNYLETEDRVNANIFLQYEDLTDQFPPIFGVIGADTYLQRRDRFIYWPFTLAFREVK